MAYTSSYTLHISISINDFILAYGKGLENGQLTPTVQVLRDDPSMMSFCLSLHNFFPSATPNELSLQVGPLIFISPLDEGFKYWMFWVSGLIVQKCRQPNDGCEREEQWRRFPMNQVFFFCCQRNLATKKDMSASY